MRKYKVFLFGSGKEYDAYLNNVLWECDKENIDIVGIISQDFYYKTIDNYDIISIDEINNYIFDYIIVTEVSHFQKTTEMLMKQGISRDKLINASVLQIPHFDFKQYIDLRNSNISIIGNNCWGGITYHSLDLEFNSPIINMFISDTDYIKMLDDFKFYMSQPIKFEYMDKIHKYPVCSIGDVKLYCNHYKNFDEVKEKWEKRVAKINYDNLFFMYYTEDETLAKKFDCLNFEKKVVFTNFECHLKAAIPYQIFSLNTINQKYKNQFWEFVNDMPQAKRCVYYNIFNLLNGDNPTNRIISINTQEINEINKQAICLSKEKEPPKKYTFWQRIFSVTNESTQNEIIKFKSIIFLGLQIKFLISHPKKTFNKYLQSEN